MNFLHNFEPNAILISWGPLHVYWYGFFIALSALTAIIIALKLSNYYHIKKEKIIDLAFYLIIIGIIGGRIYDVFLEFPYYYQHPLDIFKIWQGGLAIHGGVIAGVLVLYFWAKKENENFWLIGALSSSVMPIAQAIGRWGNYFNQELFGLPTNLAWGIPINIMHRPLKYISTNFFHPTFLYESLGNLFIFLILLSLNFYIIKKEKFNNYYYRLIIASYLILYSLLRFFLEFIRIDYAPAIGIWRWPQIASLITIILALGIIFLPKLKKYVNLNASSHTKYLNKNNK